MGIWESTVRSSYMWKSYANKKRFGKFKIQETAQKKSEDLRLKNFQRRGVSRKLREKQNSRKRIRENYENSNWRISETVKIKKVQARKRLKENPENSLEEFQDELEADVHQWHA